MRSATRLFTSCAIFSVLTTSILLTAKPIFAQQRHDVDFMLTPVASSVRRTYGLTGGSAGSESFSLIGIEASALSSEQSLGIGGRYYTGQSSSGKTSRKLDGFLLVGSPTFRFEAAYTARSFLPIDSTLSLARGGFATNTFLGTSGISLRFRAGYYLPLKKPKISSDKIEGWEGETAAVYTWRQFPVTGMLGYRMERLQAYRFDEQQSAVFVGAGIWFWGR